MDHNEVLDQKLDGQKFTYPAVISGIQDLLILQMVSIVDIKPCYPERTS